MIPLRTVVPVLALLLLILPAWAQTSAGGVETRRDIVYATHEGERLLADWYGPSAPGSYPALIAIHGGGWQAGDKTGYRHWGPFLRIGLIGDSAGGHLAALVGLAGDHPTFAGAYGDDPHARQSTRVKAIVGIYGVYDFPAQWLHDQVHRPTDQITEKFVGLKPMDDRKLYFDVSPLSYTTFPNAGPSVFLAWGTEDDIVDPKTQSEAFLLALKQARFYVRTAIIPGAPHFWMWDPIEEPDSRTGWLAPRLLRFLEERL
jgi:acetyl esterase/lipase